MTARPILEADGLGKTFGERTVLKAGAFAAYPGGITALVGRNGAGKSTMLRIAVGRIRPDYGRILWRGRFVERPSLAALALDGLLYSTQSSALTDHFTLQEHLDAMARSFGGRERIPEILAFLELGEFLDRRPRQLSGGERQRASVGLALLRAPDCLLMDEPFAGVEPMDRPLVAWGLARLREAGTAIVISGHDVEDIFGLSDRILWVTAGTTHWLGTPAEAARHEQFRREYLGPGRLEPLSP